jgi:steroid 5-alpha reductase family enzyme
MTVPILINLALCLGSALVVVLIAFAIGTATGKHRVVDVFWGLGFAAVAVTTLVASAGHGSDVRRWLITALTVLWGVRLAVHIGWRGRGEPEDPRYTALLDRAKGNRNLYALRTVYLLQGLSLWFISLPVQVGQYDRDALSPTSYAGILVFAVGLFFEAVGDAQLAAFRADPANRGTVMDRGLWRYTRHPNYFGDACVWWGISLVAFSAWPGVLTILSPVVMTWLLARGTGKPLLEKDMAERRPGYADYVRRTSGFVPLPPRRA